MVENMQAKRIKKWMDADKADGYGIQFCVSEIHGIELLVHIIIMYVNKLVVVTMED
jgi:hypothetical protein